MMFTVAKSPWFRCFNPRPEAAFRLFCLPYAGAGASAFRLWAQAADPTIEVHGIQLPGRESRRQESLFTTVESVVDALSHDMGNWLDKPFAIFGHSLGALIAFELIRRLQKSSLPLPQRLFVSARQAPQLPLDSKQLHLLPAAHLKEELRHYAGTPEVILQDASLMNLLLPIIRADLTMNETYDYVSGCPVSCPISAFAGLNDSQVSVASVKAWSAQTSLDFKIHHFDGNHFFIKEAYPAILRTIRTELDLVKSIDC